MGYGIDTKKFTTRKWSTMITWKGTIDGKLQEALNIWQSKLGITFSKTEGNVANFEVKWGDRDGWSPGVGHPLPSIGSPLHDRMGQLNLKNTASLGTLLHEIGHLLGLSHEQDRPDARVRFYEANPQFNFGLEGAIGRADLLATYGAYDPDSIMHYPTSHYAAMSEPSPGDIATVKEINGW